MSSNIKKGIVSAGKCFDRRLWNPVAKWAEGGQLSKSDDVTR